MEARDPASAALRRELRSRLGRIGTPLQILAEDVLGEDDGRIDWVAIEPGGRVCLVLVDGTGGDDALLVRGLAQRAWVQARIGDWLQLAPGLPARNDLRPRLLLLAPEFSRVARLAAREVDADGLWLGRFRWQAGATGPDLVIEPLSAPPPAPAESPRSPAPLASVFRSGLGERDFAGNGAKGEASS